MEQQLPMVNTVPISMGSLKRVYPKKKQSRVEGWEQPRGMKKRNPLKIYLEQMARGTR